MYVGTTCRLTDRSGYHQPGVFDEFGKDPLPFFLGYVHIGRNAAEKNPGYHEGVYSPAPPVTPSLSSHGQGYVHIRFGSRTSIFLRNRELTQSYLMQLLQQVIRKNSSQRSYSPCLESLSYNLLNRAHIRFPLTKFF